MKKLLLILIVSSLFSCEHKDYDSLYGKWGFNDKEGSYGEIWIDENRILFIHEGDYYSNIHKYSLANDSISVLNYTDTNYAFYIKSLNKNKLTLNDSYLDYDCFRISPKVNIDTSKVFKDRVYKEFGKRLSNQSSDPSQIVNYPQQIDSLVDVEMKLLYDTFSINTVKCYNESRVIWKEVDGKKSSDSIHLDKSRLVVYVDINGEDKDWIIGCDTAFNVTYRTQPID